MDRSKIRLPPREKLETYLTIGHNGVLGERYKINSRPLEEGQKIISDLGS